MTQEDNAIHADYTHRVPLYLVGLSLFLLCLAAWPQKSDAEADPRSEVAFSPNGESLQLILKGIVAAEREILVAGYSFTSKPIAEALLAAYKRGVAVRVVVDAKSNSGRYTAATFLANHEVPVRRNSNYAIMHHKFMVIDGEHVQTGSFNYSAAAVSRNAENVLMLWNTPEIAGIYTREWQRLWDEAVPMPPAY